LTSKPAFRFASSISLERRVALVFPELALDWVSVVFTLDFALVILESELDFALVCRELELN